MTTLFYRFTLNRHLGFPPATVAAAIDVNANDVEDAGEAILLQRTGLTWTGTHDVEGGTEGLVVMSHFLGVLGARYSITVREDDEDGTLLASSSGFVSSVPQVQFVMLGGQ